MNSLLIPVYEKQHHISEENRRFSEERERQDRLTAYKQECEQREHDKTENLRIEQEKREDLENRKRMPKALTTEEKRLQKMRQSLRICGIRPDF